MTSNIGPRMKPAQEYPKPAKNDHEAGPSGKAHRKPNPDQAPTHTPGQAAPASMRGKSRLEPISEEGPSTGSGPDSPRSGRSSNGSSGSGESMMDEIFAKLGGNWADIKKDLNKHEEYEKACDRNPFIKAHLDPDIPSPRAGKQKDHWLERPGPDLSGGSAPREGGDRVSP
jgi:hypothetical protein